MTPQEAISYIENCGWSTTRLGLDRTYALLHELGNPQKNLKFIHVAGSNGKGSTCAMLDAVLRAAGYKTGLYTSPYIENFCERIQVNGINISGTDLADITEQVKIIADGMADHPSQFELCTAIAMVYFAKENCDIVVLEVGMGGALDSTNAIDAPELAVITNIGLEHTEYLGDTLEKIAATKAGIIKEGTSVILYEQSAQVEKVIRKKCAECNSGLTVTDTAQEQLELLDMTGQTFSYRKRKNLRLNLLGTYQVYNAAVVLDAVDALNQRGFTVSEEDISKGLAHVVWPARMELLGQDPLFLLDGAHNPQCMTALRDSLRSIWPDTKIAFLTGVLADKEYTEMMNTLLPAAAAFFCLTPCSERALPAEALAEYLCKQGANAVACATIESGLQEAFTFAERENVPVVACGSLYMAGAIREAFCRCL